MPFFPALTKLSLSRLCLTCGALWLTSGCSFSQELISNQNDPFSEKPILSAEDMAAKMVFIQSEWIEVDTNAITNLLFAKGIERSGAELRAELEKWIEAKQAKVVESTALFKRLGEKARSESVKKDIYATEYKPIAAKPKRTTADGKVVSKAEPALCVPEAYEERPVGTIVEASTEGLDEDWRNIKLRYEPVIINRHKDLVYRTDKAAPFTHKAVMPTFSEIEQETLLTMRDGKTQLVSVQAAIDSEGNNKPSKKIVHFTTATIILVK